MHLNVCELRIRRPVIMRLDHRLERGRLMGELMRREALMLMKGEGVLILKVMLCNGVRIEGRNARGRCLSSMESTFRGG